MPLIDIHNRDERKMSAISENLQRVRERLTDALQRAGRPATAARLIAVSKTFPAECVADAVAAGQREFGENRVQELAAKAPRLPDGCEWHLIGHLQQNKVRQALEYAAWIHAVDSLKLLQRIQLIAAELAVAPNVLLEVNVSGEASKFGLAPDAVEAVLQGGREGPAQICGLMTIAPLEATPTELAAIFAGLRRLRDRLAEQTGMPLPELSMGMSGDFEIAVAEGATMVRVGSAIFGHR